MNGTRSIITHAVILSFLFCLGAVRTEAQVRHVDHNEGDAEARDRAFYGTRAYPFERIPQHARLDALLQAREKMAPYRSATSTLAAQRWKPIGPYDAGGRVTTIALSPTDGATVFAGAAAGGIWKSTDGGATWKPIMDDENAITLGAIAIDPTNPDEIYAGTGEAATNVDSYGGAGLFKSIDGGLHWTIMGLTTVASFSRIAIRPDSTAIIFAAGVRNNAGLYRSSNRGVTWTRTRVNPTTDITINPANPNEMWIGGGAETVMHSTDGGRTFSPSAVGIGAGSDGTGRVSIQVAPSRPTTLYALVDEFSFAQGSLSRIYKSTDAGAHWAMVLDNAPNLLNFYGHAQGAYNNVIAVEPDNPDVVVAGGVVLVRTTDGGAHWTTIEGPLHPDHHALVFDPAHPGRLYIGNDGGMYRSEDAGATFARISDGLAITQFYAMAIDQSQPDVTYGGTQDNGTISNSAGPYWERGPGIVGDGDGFFTAVDARDSTRIYFEQPNGRMFVNDPSGGGVRLFTEGINLSDQSDPAAWSAPFINDPTNPDRWYCGRTYVYRRTTSTDWLPISPQFRTPISALAVSPLDSNVIYAASGMATGGQLFLSDGVPLGELMRTTDGGGTWLNVPAGSALPNRVATDIAPSAHDRCTAWISFSGFGSGHVFRTTDCGASWTDVGRPLPDIPVNALALHPDDERIIYAGTDIGVFITADGGAHWWPYSDGLPRVVVSDLAIHRGRRMLRAATHGRSMFEIPLEQATPAVAVTAPAGGEVWIGGTEHDISWSGINGPVDIQYSAIGTSWIPIAFGTTTNPFRWRVPDIETSNAIVRIIWPDSLTRSPISRTFSIVKRQPGLVVGGTLQALPCWGLAFDGTHLWATVENSDTLLELDATTLAVVKYVKITGAAHRRMSDITFRRLTRTFYAHDVTNASLDTPGGALLLEIDSTGAVLHSWPSPCAWPTGLAWVPGAADGHLLATDVGGSESFYDIDPGTGAVLRTTPRTSILPFGPQGLTATGTDLEVWQVIAEFDPNTGPQGSFIERISVTDQTARCSIPLCLTPDSTSAGGYQAWGRLFARGIERDPRDSMLWITNVDGAIYKVIPCSPVPAAVPAGPAAADAPAFDDIAPNPCTSTAHLSFTLPHAVAARVVVVDAMGRTLRTLADAAFAAGRHDLLLDAAGLAAGTYRCGVITASGAVWRPVVVMR